MPSAHADPPEEPESKMVRCRQWIAKLSVQAAGRLLSFLLCVLIGTWEHCKTIVYGSIVIAVAAWCIYFAHPPSVNAGSESAGHAFVNWIASAIIFPAYLVYFDIIFLKEMNKILDTSFQLHFAFRTNPSKSRVISFFEQIIETFKKAWRQDGPLGEASMSGYAPLAIPMVEYAAMAKVLHLLSEGLMNMLERCFGSSSSFTTSYSVFSNVLLIEHGIIVVIIVIFTFRRLKL